MTQNIYDDETFFAGYSALSRSVKGLAGAPEWPSIRALLPEPAGLRVLDLGCGFGWFCRWARGNGASRVVGVDVSEKMLARARGETQDSAIVYEQADLEHYKPPAAAFDLVHSSRALHYIENLEALIAASHRALIGGGWLVFSVEHPLFTAPAEPGWTADGAGQKSWPVNGYLREGPRSTDWLAKGVIKRHRTIATYVALLIRAGFTLAHIEEWGPTDAQIAAQPDLADERERPTFAIFAAHA